LVVCIKNPSSGIAGRSLLMFRAIVDVDPGDAKDLKRFATFLNIL
jgi:hypothetical protein